MHAVQSTVMTYQTRCSVGSVYFVGLICSGRIRRPCSAAVEITSLRISSSVLRGFDSPRRHQELGFRTSTQFESGLTCGCKGVGLLFDCTKWIL